MSALKSLSGPPRRASLAAAFAVGVVLLMAPLSAAVVVNPWQDAPSVATEVAPIDAPGANVLEQPGPALPAVTASKGDDVERVVGEWNPTSGGKGGGPKGSPKQ